MTETVSKSRQELFLKIELLTYSVASIKDCSFSVEIAPLCDVNLFKILLQGHYYSALDVQIVACTEAVARCLPDFPIKSAVIVDDKIIEKFEQYAVTEALNKLNQTIQDIAVLTDHQKKDGARIDVLNSKIDSMWKLLGSYSISTSNVTVNSCVRGQHKNESTGKHEMSVKLGHVIAKADGTILGALMAINNCAKWSSSKSDHYFSTTNNPDGCSKLLSHELSFHACVEALGMSMNIIGPEPYH